MFAQHIVNQIAVDGDLPPRPFRAGLVAFDQSGDDGDGAEGAFQHGASGQPFLQVVAKHVLVEQGGEGTGGAEGGNADRVIGGGEAKRPQAHAFHAPCQQHAKRLMRVAALETIGDEIPDAAARKRLDQQIVASRQAGDGALQFQPLPHRIRERGPGGGGGQQGAHAGGEMGGQRQPAASIRRDFGRAGAAFRAFDGHFANARES